MRYTFEENTIDQSLDPVKKHFRKVWPRRDPCLTFSIVGGVAEGFRFAGTGAPSPAGNRNPSQSWRRGHPTHPAGGPRPRIEARGNGPPRPWTPQEPAPKKQTNSTRRNPHTQIGRAVFHALRFSCKTGGTDEMFPHTARRHTAPPAASQRHRPSDTG